MLEDKTVHIDLYVQQSQPSEMKEELQNTLGIWRKENPLIVDLQEIPKDSSFRLKLKDIT